MIGKKLAIDVLNEMLSTGADYAEIFYDESTGNGITIENGRVSSSSSGLTSGAGLRLLKENQTVYGYTSDLTRKGLMTLAGSLKSSFSGKRLITVERLDAIRYKNRNPIKRSYNDVPKQEIIDLIRDGTNELDPFQHPCPARHF